MLGNVNAILKGREAEKVYFYNALAVADDNPKTPTAIDVRKYKKISIYVYSTLDATIDVYYRLDNNTARHWNGTTFQASYHDAPSKKASISVPGQLHNLDDFFDEISDSVFEYLQVCFKSQTVPTTGSVTIYIIGELN